MRAWVFSDLHLDANVGAPFVLPEERPEHDVVIIAGDICQGLAHGVSWIVAQGLNAKPVIYVPGNHEYFGFDLETERGEGRRVAARQRNVHVLDRDSVMIDGVRFLGATLWSDYSLFGDGIAVTAMARAEAVMNDHRRIRFQGRRWAAADAASEHCQSLTWLREQIETGEGQAVVVVTHTAPSMKSIAARYKDDLVTAAFASNLENLARLARLWVHGHTHVGSDYRLGGCRVLNNPRGYIASGEGEAFSPTLICEV